MVRIEEQYIVRIRVFAIMMIVLLHVSAPVRDQWHVMASVNWFISAIFDSFGRAGVPLFVMISGSLLLPRNEEWVTFYKKRFSRILLPMFFWSLVYGIFWYWQIKEDLSLTQLLINVFGGPTYYHLWYFYMLLGLYIATPFFQVLVQNLTKKRIEFLLLIWILFRFILPFIFGQLSVWFNIQLSFGIQQNFPDLYIGYFILGYYLRKYGIPFKFNYYGLLFISITLIQTFISAAIYKKTGSYQEMMILPSSLTVLIQATLFYAWMQNMKNLSIPQWMKHISVASFGIYLIHPLVIEILRLGIGEFHIDAKMSDTILSIPATWAVTFCFATIVIIILLKIPYLKRLVS